MPSLLFVSAIHTDLTMTELNTHSTLWVIPAFYNLSSA